MIFIAIYLTFIAKVRKMDFDINKINPYIRVAMRSVIPKNSRIRERTIFDYELIFIEKGEFVLRYDGRDYPCKEGQFILLRPDVPHSFEKIRCDLYQPHIHFDMFYSVNSERTPVSFKRKEEFSNSEISLLQKDIFLPFPKTPYVSFENKEKVLEIFYSVIDAPFSSLSQKGKMLSLIEMLISDNFSSLMSSAKPNYGVAHQIKDYIDAGQGYSLKLDDFEKLFSYSKYHIERQFKSNFKVNLIEYRNNKKMETALKMLKEKSVSAVSDKLGFSSIYAFSRAFKKHFGFPPSKIN